MIKKTPLVSIIINCFNGEKYLNACIKSVLKQSYQNWEIIFWDNKSTDLSLNIIKKFKDKRIKIFKSKEHTTLYKARNEAFKKCKGFYISFIDTDDTWHIDKLKKQVEIMEKNKNISFSYSNYYIFDQQKKTKIKAINKKKETNNLFNSLLKDYNIGLLTLIIKKNIFSKNKIFNDKYNIIGDMDLCLKMSMKHKAIYDHSILAIFRHHRKNMNFLNKRLEILELKNWYTENIVKKKLFKKYSNCKFFLNYILYNLCKYFLKKRKKIVVFKFFNKMFLSVLKIKIFILLILPRKFIDSLT